MAGSELGRRRWRGLADVGGEVLHVFLEVDADVLGPRDWQREVIRGARIRC
jgi:hypothetical protein